MSTSKSNQAYKKVLKELDKVRKLSQYTTYRNALVDIKYSTEDETLRGLIDRYVVNFVEITDSVKARLTVKAKMLLDESVGDKNALREYCEGIVASGKPEWMVCAEANGWVCPANNKSKGGNTGRVVTGAKGT